MRIKALPLALAAAVHAAALGALYFTSGTRPSSEWDVDLAMYVHDDDAPRVLPSPVVPLPPPDAPSEPAAPIDVPLEEIEVLEARPPEIVERFVAEPLRPIRVRPPKPPPPAPPATRPPPESAAAPAPPPAAAPRPPASAGATRPPRSPTRTLPVDYPDRARREGLEGRVVLRLHVASDGRVASAEVARSSGHALLDEAALAAAERWAFEPALRDGAPVEAWVLVPVRFALE